MPQVLHDVVPANLKGAECGHVTARAHTLMKMASSEHSQAISNNGTISVADTDSAS